jgi:RNA polymerase sigma-70 factor (ECF subfamily)
MGMTDHADQPWHDEAASDATLVRASMAGDRSAFAQLVRRHHRRVRGLAILLVPDAHAAEDVIQETFLRAYRGLRDCADPDRFGAWVSGIARNHAREWLRSRRIA